MQYKHVVYITNYCANPFSALSARHGPARLWQEEDISISIISIIVYYV